MRLALLLVAAFALAGCTVGLHGHEAAGSTSAVTSSSLRLQSGAGPARVSGSFGAPLPQGAPGAHVAFPRGASAVLVIGAVVAGTLHYLGAQFGEQPAPEDGPQRTIADTCSCYGYRPSLPHSPALSD